MFSSQHRRRLFVPLSIIRTCTSTSRTSIAAETATNSISIASRSSSTSTRWYSSSRSINTKGPKDLSLPPLPPPPLSNTNATSGAAATALSPAKAKQEFLKTAEKLSNISNDPLQKIARLQKELDIVRDRAAERMEQKLNKSVWRRLTDPLKREKHSWINVGAVLLAYILAHNLYMTAREKKQIQQELQEVAALNDTYQEAMRELLQEGTLRQVAEACVQELSHPHQNKDESSSGSSFWTKSVGLSSNKKDQQQQQQQLDAIRTALTKELQQRIGDHTLTEEERRIKAMQQAWEESQQQIIVVRERISPSSSSSSSSEELALVQAVLSGDDAAMEKAAGGEGDSGSITTKKQRRVISM